LFRELVIQTGRHDLTVGHAAADPAPAGVHAPRAVGRDLDRPAVSERLSEVHGPREHPGPVRDLARRPGGVATVEDHTHGGRARGDGGEEPVELEVEEEPRLARLHVDIDRYERLAVEDALWTSDLGVSAVPGVIDEDALALRDLLRAELG